MAKDKITFETEDGEKIDLEIFLTYHSETFNKDYIVFYDQNGELVAGSVDENGDIHDIELDAEYDELDEIIDEYQEEKQNNSEN